jgi:peptidyl-tRNA hydrolase
MKTTIHKIWDTLYRIRVGIGHASPEDAVRDALVPKEERELEYMRKLVSDIAASGETEGGFAGETAEQMMQRLCPE